MNRPLIHDVLTLAEAARFLRFKPARLRKLAEIAEVPARQVDGEWRFFRAALEDWLRGTPRSADLFLRQAGTLADDDTLPDLLRAIYKARGRPMIDEKE